MERFIASMASDLDELASVALWSMTPQQQRDALLGLTALAARVAELRLRVLQAADLNQVGAASGATSTPAWLADTAKSTRPSCFRDLRLAQALDHDDFAATRTAFAAGRIDTEKALVIVQAIRDLTREHDDLPDGTEAKAQAHLLDLAGQFDAPTLRQLGKRLLEVVCPEAADAEEGRKLEDEEKRARRTTFLSMRDNGDGTVDGRFRLSSLHGDLLKKVLETLTSPRRLGSGRYDPQTGQKLSKSTLFGLGLVDLLQNHLDLDRLPHSQGSPFTLVVHVSLETLRAELGVATTENGTRISAAEARRLACRAGIIPMVLGGDSMPLDLGRERRLFSKHQKIALDHRYKGCAADNCDRPPSWVEYHHEDPWHRGGRTDLHKGLPFCPPHHWMADHPRTYDMRRLPNGAIRFTLRT